MLGMTRSWRAASESQPRVRASSRRVWIRRVGFECGFELGGGDVVVALFADFGVGACVGDEVEGAGAVGDAGS